MDFKSTISEWEKSKEGKAWMRKQKLITIFVYTPIRIVLFPIALLIRVYRWVYYYND